MNWKRMLWTGAAAGWLAACASSTPEIKPEWMARVPQDRMDPIYRARTDVRRSEDQVVRARVELGDATQKLAVERSLLDAAKARTQAAEKQLEATKQTGNGPLISRAQQDLANTRNEEKLAARRVDAAAARIEFAEAREELAEAQSVRASAELEQTEFQALQENGDIRIQGIPPSAFQKSVESAQIREQKAKQRLQSERNELQKALQGSGSK